MEYTAFVGCVLRKTVCVYVGVNIKHIFYCKFEFYALKYHYAVIYRIDRRRTLLRRTEIT